MILGYFSIPKGVREQKKLWEKLPYGEIIPVCSDIRTEHTNTLCEQRVECLYFNPLPANVENMVSS